MPWRNERVDPWMLLAHKNVYDIDELLARDTPTMKPWTYALIVLGFLLCGLIVALLLLALFV